MEYRIFAIWFIALHPTTRSRLIIDVFAYAVLTNVWARWKEELAAWVIF
jgi:hypothetical protein